MLKKILPISFISVCLLAGLASSSSAATGVAITTTSKASADLASRRAALDALLKEQWEYSLKRSPEYASILGDKRYNDKLSDFSQAAIDADLKMEREFLKRFEAINSKGFPEQEQLNKELMVRRLKSSVEAQRFQEWQMPVLQNSGIHLDSPELVASLSFVTVKDYEDYLARLKQLPTAFDQVAVQMRNGVKNKLVPPQFLLGKIARQCDDIAALALDASPFTQPLKKFPTDFSEADKQRLSAAINDAVTNSVVPTYKKFAQFVRTDYEPYGRKEVGLCLCQTARTLPISCEKFHYHKLSAEAIHQLGFVKLSALKTKC